MHGATIKDMKICPAAAELFHADGQTDTQIEETNSRFSQFRECAYEEFAF
jgi:hypothetical protein